MKPELPSMVLRKTCLALACCGMWLASTACPAAPVHLVEEKPVASSETARGTLFLDFGRVAFGNLKLTVPTGVSSPLRVHFGEKLDGKRIDHRPPGTVRYATVEIPATPGESVVVAPPADQRNTPHFPAFRSDALALQGPPAESKLLAVVLEGMGGLKNLQMISFRTPNSG